MIDQKMKTIEKAEADDCALGSVAMDDRRLLRKIDWHLLPIMFLTYFLQMIDKISINYANVMGLQDDLHMTGNDFSWLATAFFIAYAVAEIPQGTLLQRYSVTKVLGFNILCWGIILCCSSAAKKFSHMLALRILLGLMEAVIAPALTIYTSMWYTRAESTPRYGLWYCGLGVGQIVGGLVSFGAQHAPANMSFGGWRIMFVVIGAVNILAAILVIFCLPDNLEKAHFLTEAEKQRISQRLTEDQSGAGSKVFRWHSVLEAFGDLQTWLLVLLTILITIPSGVITTFSAILIKGFGYSSKQSALLNMPSGIVSIVATMASTFAISKGFSRWLAIDVLLLPTLLGSCLMSFLPTDNQAGCLVGIYLVNTTVAPLALIYAWTGANFKGYTMKVSGAGIMSAGFSIANIIGPQTFQAKDAPQYIPAKITIVAVNAAAIVVSTSLRIVYGRRNSTADRLGRPARSLIETRLAEKCQSEDVHDDENFRYKQRCDGETPCSRCKRMHFHPRHDSKLMESPGLGHVCKPRIPERPANSTGGPNAPRRPRASRSRGGCLPCKTRKKKCDECHPRCSDCRRLNTTCQWPVSATQTEPVILDLSDGSVSNSAPGSPEYASIRDSVGESNASLSIPSPASPFDAEEFIATLFPHPLPQKKAPVISLERPLMITNPHLCTDEDKSLFNHYVHVVSRALCRSSTKRNPFLVTLLPLAAASDAVTSVILTLSGCHWKRVYPGIWGCALKRQGQAITRVNELLGCPDKKSIFEACATVLLLCLTELFDGTSRVWKWHLKAASAILKSGAFPTVASDEWDFCISLFHYLDSMSTISRCKAPLLQATENSGDVPIPSRRNSVPELGRNDSTETIYGIPPALLDLLGMVNVLANHRSRRVDELSEIGFRATATHIEDEIDEWRAAYDMNATDTDNKSDTSHATTAFEWAIRLRLHQIVEGYDALHDFVKRAVTTILDCVQEVPYASRVEGCLLFPLVIAGSSSLAIERRMSVKERLMVMENTLGFSHIHHARQLLEAVWNGNETSDLNWAAVRYSQFPGVVFV
ncbi:unnamed protein product [Penicillium salamii]|nr:unnamed protein product [Penicillium salamii]CAG8226236.1 unnamed protein product [Penicillium salamii]CAG8327617.1 unnamed protein product [Penicillium salamii]